MKRSLYIIKSEAMEHRGVIRNLITDAGLDIVRVVETVIPVATLDLLYNDLNPDLRKATHLYMGCQPCEIGEVVGENAVNQLLNVCGHFTDPSKCHPKSVRGMFGFRRVENVGEASYFKNAIHRPKTREEALRDLLIFSSYFKQTV